MSKFCLCCGKTLGENELFWHKSCIYKFFSTTYIPNIDINDISKEFVKMANKLLDENSNITGVQKKISLGLSKKDGKLTILNYPLGYILKPESNEIPNIARAEHLVMSMANASDIKTPLHGLLILNDGSYAYITKRIDREGDKKIHMEDFCQLSNKPTEYKYNGSYERLGKLILEYCDNKNTDLTEYFYRLLFCFVTGNSDMHLKNFSLIEQDLYYLSPAYDLLPVNVIYPKDKDETALSLNGKKKNIRKKDFIALGLNIGLNEKVINNLIAKIKGYKDIYIQMIYNSLLDEKYKKIFIDLVNERMSVL